MIKNVKNTLGTLVRGVFEHARNCWLTLSSSTKDCALAIPTSQHKQNFPSPPANGTKRRAYGTVLQNSKIANYRKNSEIAGRNKN